jgi:hypothetical protein
MIGPSPDRFHCGAGGMNGAETLHDNQSRALPDGIEKCAGQGIGRQIRADVD